MLFLSIFPTANNDLGMITQIILLPLRLGSGDWVYGNFECVTTLTLVCSCKRLLLTVCNNELNACNFISYHDADYSLSHNYIFPWKGTWTTLFYGVTHFNIFPVINKSLFSP